MCSTVLQRQRPSSSRKADGWHQRLFSVSRALLLVVSAMVLEGSSVAAQDLQCPDGQVVIEFVADVPAAIIEENTTIQFWVTSSLYEVDNFEVNQTLSKTSSTFEPFCVPADTCLTANIQVNYLDTETEFPPVFHHLRYYHPQSSGTIPTPRSSEWEEEKN